MNQPPLLTFNCNRDILLDQICRSDEIRELVQRLRYEDGAYPQTVVTIEEE